MATFISAILSEIRNQYNGDYRKLCVVFPTRRACLIFRKQLAELHETPVWAPGVMAIGDFVSANVKVKVAEEIPLLVALFDVYKKYWPEQDFGKYYSWGKMLISDFDEIDKQLYDPTSVFSNISELKKIEAAFLPEPESLKWINDFVSTISEEKLSYLQREFANSWNRLRTIYDEYNIELDKKGIAYEGKAYRELLQSLRSKSFNGSFDHYIFAGFYGFSRAEEDMIQLLQKIKKVDVFWDADPWYILNKKHEAGHYFRKSKLVGGTFKWQDDHFGKGNKKIEIISVPLQAAQAKFTGELLGDLFRKNQLDINKTAVVLPDEAMLFPVLYAIPNEINPVNVTMGYPLEHSHFAEFIKVLHDIHKHSETDKSQNTLYQKKNVERLLYHPILKSLLAEKRADEKLQHSRVLNAFEIETDYGFNFSKDFFRKIHTSSELFSYIDKVFNIILEAAVQQKNDKAAFEISIPAFIQSEIRELAIHLEGHLHEIGLEISWQMIKECVAGLKIPFSGEPVKGLQIMGFLETRALDFETLVILNLNEGILPSSSQVHSFIPYSLRKGFGLSTYEDREATYSYHFYRLLHNAKNIYLLHNSEVNKTGGGEPSRYILQLEYELKKMMGDRLTLSHTTITTPLLAEPVHPVTVEKDDNILKILSRYRMDVTGKESMRFSSSALTTYINCKLQFYFSYIAKLKEKEVPGLLMEAADFGSILHAAMERLYKSVDRTITAEVIENLLQESEKAVEDAILTEYKTPFHQLKGGDILTAEVIKELVKRILKRDKTDTPFSIKETEGKYETSINVNDEEIRLFGIFDRVDEVNGITRIIDYKTGKVELKTSSTEELFTNPKKKTLFQLCLYSLMYRKIHPGEKFKTGFYVARNVGSGISYPEIIIDDKFLDEFSGQVSNLISEIFNPAVPFNQTEEVERCEYCPYKVICQR